MMAEDRFVTCRFIYLCPPVLFLPKKPVVIDDLDLTLPSGNGQPKVKGVLKADTHFFKLSSVQPTDQLTTDQLTTHFALKTICFYCHVMSWFVMSCHTDAEKSGTVLYFYWGYH